MNPFAVGEVRNRNGHAAHRDGLLAQRGDAHPGSCVVYVDRDGRLILTKKGKYALPETTGLIPARAVILRSGVPIAKPLDGGCDIRISRRGDLRAMNGDLILIRRDKHFKHDPAAKCELVAVTERAHSSFPAVLRMEERQIAQEPLVVKKGHRKKVLYREPEIFKVMSAEPFDTRISCDIDVEGDLMGAQPGDAVVLQVIDWPRHGVPLRAQVQQVLGAGADIRVQLKALAQSHHLSQEFPEDALAQAAALPGSVRPEDMQGRADARGTTLFTIDGADAKDFDDEIGRASCRERV